MADETTETTEEATEETTEEITDTTETTEDTATTPARPTVQDLLDNVNNAIVAVMVGGQSYKIGSRSLTRADLATLYNLRNDLVAQLAAEDSGGLLDDCYVAMFDGR